jgi:hypothetical protein
MVTLIWVGLRIFGLILPISYNFLLKILFETLSRIWNRGSYLT